MIYFKPGSVLIESQNIDFLRAEVLKKVKF